MPAWITLSTWHLRSRKWSWNREANYTQWRTNKYNIPLWRCGALQSTCLSMMNSTQNLRLWFGSLRFRRQVTCFRFYTSAILTTLVRRVLFPSKISRYLHFTPVISLNRTRMNGLMFMAAYLFKGWLLSSFGLTIWHSHKVPWDYDKTWIIEDGSPAASQPTVTWMS